MVLGVSEESRRETTRCEKDFTCLSGSKPDLCKVEYCVDGRVHFIKCLNQELCSYRLFFGKRAFCSCPVRKELFNNHGV